jgi:hypothetical protein
MESSMNNQMNDIERLARRLDLLEAQNRRLQRIASCLKLAVVVLVVPLGLLALLGADPKPADNLNVESVTAKSFTLRDSDGKIRMRMSLFDNNPTLSLTDKKGNARAALTVDDNGAKLTLFRKSGKPVVELTTQDGDNSGVLVYDDSSRLRTGVALTRTSLPTMFLRDEKGHSRLVMNLNEGGPAILISDERDVLRANVGQGLVAVFDNKGKAGATAGIVAAEFGSAFIMKDSKGGLRVRAMATKEGPKFELLDEDEKTVFSKP